MSLIWLFVFLIYFVGCSIVYCLMYSAYTLITKSVFAIVGYFSLGLSLILMYVFQQFLLSVINLT